MKIGVVCSLFCYLEQASKTIADDFCNPCWEGADIENTSNECNYGQPLIPMGIIELSVPFILQRTL